MKPTSMEEVEALLQDCPMGFVNDRVLHHRSTTEKDVVAWLAKLYELRERITRDRNAGLEVPSTHQIRQSTFAVLNSEGAVVGGILVGRDDTFEQALKCLTARASVVPQARAKGDHLVKIQFVEERPDDAEEPA